jgi:hypothetical protein
VTAERFWWCIGCARIGPEWVQKKTLAPPGTDKLPTNPIRVCPPCFDAGWRLHEPTEENQHHAGAVPRLHAIEGGVRSPVKD